MGVHVVVTPEWERLQGTDGKLLVRIHSLNEDGDQPGELVIPALACEAAMKSSDRPKLQQLSATQWMLGNTAFEPIPGKYPECDAVLQREEKYTEEPIGLSGHLLSQLAKLARLEGSGPNLSFELLRTINPCDGMRIPLRVGEEHLGPPERRSLAYAMPIKLGDLSLPARLARAKGEGTRLAQDLEALGCLPSEVEEFKLLLLKILPKPEALEVPNDSD
jgi:hypothetical protein